jgi:hypothetical protein
MRKGKVPEVSIIYRYHTQNVSLVKIYFIKMSKKLINTVSISFSAQTGKISLYRAVGSLLYIKDWNLPSKGARLAIKYCNLISLIKMKRRLGSVRVMKNLMNGSKKLQFSRSSLPITLTLPTIKLLSSNSSRTVSSLSSPTAA